MNLRNNVDRSENLNMEFNKDQKVRIYNENMELKSKAYTDI